MSVVVADTEEIRQRRVGRRHKNQQHLIEEDDVDDIKKKNTTQDIHLSKKHKVASMAVTVMSFFTTFYMIWFPSQVVFDEVHFGKFAGYYLQRVYFFDVHPPLAKLMLAAVGYVIGFDGVYTFDTIGESYAHHHVPYIPLRALPASMHVMGVYLVYQIMKESQFSVLTCFLTTTLYLLDNAFIAQSRLILLDSILIFYMLTSIYSYIKFRKTRQEPFTKAWWTWLCTTGVCMALTLSVKMVGLFVFVAVGIAVMIDLWDIIDIKHGLNKTHIMKHIGARAFGLLFVPLMVYMFWFYIHFSILTLSGPGNGYMSLQFQNTLLDSPFKALSLDVMYNQSIRLQHKETRVFLHSHEFTYPAQYQDGRYSARGQQVVGNKSPDFGSYWRLLPTESFDDPTNQPIQHDDIIQLEHIVTGSKLLTHNVAAPYTPTNQEVTTTYEESRYNETLFRVVLDDLSGDRVWSTMIHKVNLVHVNTGVGLMVNPTPLPDWGLFHFEVNGHKKIRHPFNLWIATDILGIDPSKAYHKKKSVKKMNFFKKFWELQRVMIEQNNGLTVTHPYQSNPSSWPIMSRGISYWSDVSTLNQIYLVGNVNGWWGGLLCIILYCVLNTVDAILQKRGSALFTPNYRIRLHRTGGFFLLLWSTHYFPFYLMTRSLYLHHYLPAMACNYLLIGCLFDYFFMNGSKSTIKSYLAAIMIISMQFTVYLFLSPTTYGTPSMSPKEATRHQVLTSWDLQFAQMS